MNRYDEDYDELEIPSSNPAIGTNIRQLREEKRLTQKSFSEMIDIPLEELQGIEKGTIIPNEILIKKMLPILRISYYDIMTRDILKERNETTVAMKKSSSRGSYDWYYGSRKKVLLDILYLVGVPLVFVLTFLLLKPYQDYINSQSEEIIFTDASRIIFAYLACSAISGVIFTINMAGKYHYHFQLWHLFWITTLFWLVLIAGAIITVPYYIYTIIMLIVKRGKNHL